MDYLKNNKLIAEFMGCDIKEYKNDFEIVSWPDNFYPELQNPDGAHCADNIYFNWSWDWLMPVVEKISNLGYPFNILFGGDNEIYINTNEHPAISCNNEGITSIYSAVIEFIKWYNKNK